MGKVMLAREMMMKDRRIEELTQQQEQLTGELQVSFYVHEVALYLN